MSRESSLTLSSLNHLKAVRTLHRTQITSKRPRFVNNQSLFWEDLGSEEAEEWDWKDFRSERLTRTVRLCFWGWSRNVSPPKAASCTTKAQLPQPQAPGQIFILQSLEAKQTQTELSALILWFWCLKSSSSLWKKKKKVFFFSHSRSVCCCGLHSLLPSPRQMLTTSQITQAFTVGLCGGKGTVSQPLSRGTLVRPSGVTQKTS